MKKIIIYLLSLIILITLVGCQNVNQIQINETNQEIEIIEINNGESIRLYLNEAKQFKLNDSLHTITFNEIDKTQTTKTGDYFIFVTLNNETKNLGISRETIFKSNSIKIITNAGHYIDDIYIELGISSWQSLSDKYNTLDLTEKDIFEEEFKNSLYLSFDGILIGDTLEEVNRKKGSNIEIPDNTRTIFEYQYWIGTKIRFEKGLEDFEVSAIFFREDANSVLVGNNKIGVAEDMKSQLADLNDNELSLYEKKKGIRFYFKDGEQKGMTLVMPQ